MKSKLSNKIKVITEDPFIILDNGRIAIRLARKFSAGKKSPGPILGIRSIKGPWLCSGTFEGNLREGKGRVISRENHSIVYEAVIEVEDGGEYRMKVELAAGEDFVKIGESMKSCEGSAMHLGFDGLAPEKMAVAGYPGYPAEILDPNSYVPPFGVVSGSIAAIGSQQVCGQIGTPWFALSDGNTALGAIVCSGGDWLYPGDNTLRLIRTGKGLVLSGEASHGSRQWLLFAGADKNWMPKMGESATAMSQLKKMVSDLPAEKVDKWILDIPDAMSQPTIWVDRKGLDAARKNLDAPEWDKLIESIDRIKIEQRAYAEDESCCFGMDGTTDSFRNGILWLKLKKDSYGRALAEDIHKWSADATARFKDNGFLGQRVDIVTLRTLKHCLYWYDLLRGSGLMPEKTACEIRRSLIFCAYCMYDRDYFDWESAYAPAWSEHSIRRFLLEEDYSDTMGCENFHADIFSYIGAVGIAFPNHPMSSEWIDHAEKMTLANLEYYIAPDGTYVESDNYYQHLLGLLYYLGYALGRTGRKTVMEHPRMLAGLKYWVRAQTPLLRHTGAPQTNWFGVYTANPKQRPISQMLSLGDAGLNWGGQSLPSFLHHAANYYAKSNPQLSGWLEWAWRRGGRPLANYNFSVQELLTQALSGPKPCEYPLESEEFEGHGVMMRAGVSSKRETAVLVSTGRATSHMHFDGGGLAIWHAGVPLAADPGYIHDEFTPERQYGGESWKHSVVTFEIPGLEKANLGYLGMEHMQQPVAVSLGDSFDYAACDLSLNNVRDGLWRAVRRIVSVEHYRQILYVKDHDYIVVKDSIYRSIYPAIWNLWTLSDKEQIEGASVRIIGRYGVDLLVTFVQPEMPELKARAFSTARNLRVIAEPERDFTVVLQPVLAGKPGYSVKGIRDGVQVSGGNWTEKVLLDPMPGIGSAGEWHCSKHDDGRQLLSLRRGFIGDDSCRVAARCAVVRGGKTIVVH